MATSAEITVTSFMVEDLMTEYSEKQRYFTKVVLTFIYIQIIVNWLCTVCNGSELKPTLDRPDLEKSLWVHNNEGSTGTRVGGRVDRTGLHWKWCSKCRIEQPPRCHHCKICDKCILKRDHHCIFTATCIGFYNQRNFTVLVFYTTLSISIYLPMLWNYFYWYSNQHWVSYILPIAIFKFLTGGLSFKWMILVSQLYTMWWMGFMAFSFLCSQILVISKGVTSYELHKKIPIRCTAGVKQNFRDVFGDFWALNLIFPTQLVFGQKGNGKNWEYLKIEEK